MITKDMTVGEVIRVKEDAAEVHGFDVETLLEALNK